MRHIKIECGLSAVWDEYQYNWFIYICQLSKAIIINSQEDLINFVYIVSMYIISKIGTEPIR